MAFGLGNMLVIAAMLYFTLRLVEIADSRKRVVLIRRNEHLDELRREKILTLEQQKDFLNTKFPKAPPVKMTWRMLLPTLRILAFGVGLFFVYKWILDLVHFRIGVLLALGCIFAANVIFELILRKAKLEKNDMWRIIR